MLNIILTYLFYLLFFLTPLIWTPFNFELFEYNKMMFVYLLTTIVVSLWLIKMILEKKLIFKSTPLNIPLLLFLGANILSTIFSIDRHTSIWGYYSRSNGGLLSILSYTLLYFAFVSNFEKNEALNFLKAAVFGGLIVALYAIPEHFGVSPSCVILVHQFTADCWVQDVQARVFATLGQPNWLAAYLAMLIFPAFYFLFTVKTKFQSFFYSFCLMVFYLAFTFSYSRGATLGLIAGFLVFILTTIWKKSTSHISHTCLPVCRQARPAGKVGGVILGFLLINLLFGSALTDLKLLSKFSPPPRPSLISQASTGTQLESGGTESGQIRLIVWQGALDIFKNYPIFGSGVETFAYSYYNFRPVSHNLVSEWDFLYNKAHNEYLNYLANMGLVGFICYFIIIIIFIIIILKRLKKPDNNFLILTAILASYIANLVQNFFGFSVVLVALFFYLFPAILFLATDSTRPISKLFTLIYRRPFYKNLAIVIISVISAGVIIILIKNYWADTYFALSNNANEGGNYGKAYNQLSPNFFPSAVSLNPNEPYYRSELGFAAAASAVIYSEDDSITSAKLKNEAVLETENALKISPKNVSFHRTKIRTYYLLSTIDKSFVDKTLKALDETIILAPTDAKLIYNKAVILEQTGKNKEAIQNFEKAVSLKPNYRDAYYSLGILYFNQGEKEKAKKEMQKILQLIPNDPEALKKLEEWNK